MKAKLFILATLVFVALQVVQHFYKLADFPHPEGLVPPPQFVEHMAFGYHESMADSLWIRTIQDFEACEILKKNPEKYYGVKTFETPKETPVDPKLDRNLFEQLNSIPKPATICGRGWAYTMMDAATNLAPRFRAPYIFGATGLSVIMNDFDGAKLMFDKGVKNFPEDWRILYRAAYHYLYDRKDLKSAAALLNQASEHGGPIWVKSLAARLYTQAGQAELGLTLLRQYLQEADNDVAKADIQKRIAILEQKIKNSKNSP